MSSKVCLGELVPRLGKSTVYWKIENFSSIDAVTGVSVSSPVFETAHPRVKKLEWQLNLYPGGFIEENKDYLGLFLHYLGDYQVSVSYSLAILIEERGNVIEFRPDVELTSYKKNISWGANKLCLKTTVRDRALTNDTLLISCTITVKSTSLDDEHYDAEDSARVYFEKLLESGDMSDVTFEIEKKQMRLHKTIVASLSPVFLAMFQHQMKEKEEGVVKITDMKYDVMMELFRYIYVRKVNRIKSIVGDLLVAADKYDVQGLKILCENILAQNLDVDNALRQLEIAFEYNTTFLKSKVVEFVVNRLEEFVDRPEFDRMDGICKGELLRAIAKNKVKSVT